MFSFLFFCCCCCSVFYLTQGLEKVIKYKLPPQTLTYGLSLVIKNTLLNYNFNFSHPFPRSFFTLPCHYFLSASRLNYLKYCFVNTDGQLSWAMATCEFVHPWKTNQFFLCCCVKVDLCLKIKIYFCKTLWISIIEFYIFLFFSICFCFIQLHMNE